MTENVLSNIFESLSLDDVAAAETQITEWFDSVAMIQESNSGSYVLESEAFMDTAAVWGFESPEDAQQFVALYQNGGGQFQVRIIDAGASDDLPTSLAPVGCMSGITADGLAVWMQENGSDGLGYAVQTIVNDESIGAMDEGAQHEVVPTDDENVFNVRDKRNGKIVGMGLDADSAEKYARNHKNLPHIGESVESEEVEEETIEESINTTRRCGECGEIDAAMDENAEFCDQCIQEANDANPDMCEAIDPALAELMEEFKGFTVVDKLSNKEGAQVGNADAIQVNDKSPVPNIKASKRVGGAPVEIHAEEHKGFDAEKAPAVKDVKLKNPAPVAEPGEFSDKLDNVEGAQVGNADKVDINKVSPIGSKPRD